MSKRPRTLDAFITRPPTKKSRIEASQDDTTVTPKQKDTTEEAEAEAESTETSTHPTYPFPIPHLPPKITDHLNFAPATEPRHINNQPDLDLLYYNPYIPTPITHSLFAFLRRSLPFYRVKYPIKRGPTETIINTPRYTTVFGIDSTACFTPAGEILDSTTNKCIPRGTYKCRPRPLPQPLEHLRLLTEASTNSTFNFALVNYYADGSDSISYHSDDERFLGPQPTIASFTLGASRDFLMKHKPTPSGHVSETKPMKFPLGGGDMVLMRGKTQERWLHSIPKRKGKGAGEGGGRINITLRRAMVRGGTENYYRYNVGEGEVYRWDEARGEMREVVGGGGEW